MVYGGLDLHKRYITACAVTSDGRVVAEIRQLSTTWEALAAWLAALGAPLTVVLEATLYCWWLERQLTAAGHTAIVVNAYQGKLIWATRTKTDPIDAHKLAELARVHLLPALWVPDPHTRTLRQALRGRVFLVRQRTVIKNRIHAYLTAENLRCPQVDLYRKAGRAWLASVDLPRVVRRYVELLLSNLDQLSARIRSIDKALQRECQHDAVSERLQTIPGVGPFGALLLQAEIGPDHPLPQRSGARGVRRPHAEHAELRGKDAARRRWAREPVAQVDPHRDPPGAETGAGARGRAL